MELQWAMASAWKVGLLVVVFVGLLMAAFAVLQASVFATPSETYTAEFLDAGGLTSGSAVLYAGVKIGEVAKIELSERSTALVTLAIDEGNKVPLGTTAVLPGSFISLGDKQVLLRPPAVVEGFYASGKAQGEPIPGILEGPLDSIFPDSEKTMEELNKTMVAFQELLGDEELKGGLKGMMAAGEDTLRAGEGTLRAGEGTAKEFSRLAGNLNSTLERNSTKIDGLMSSVATSMQNLADVSAKIKEVATDGKLEAQANELMDTINRAAKQGELLVGDLRNYTNDPEIKDSLKGTMQNFETMSQSGVRIASDAELMTKNGVEISEQTKELMIKANKLADEVSRALEDLKGSVNKIVAGGGGGLIPKVDVEADLVRESSPGRFRTDVNLSMPLGDQRLILGMYDAFESNKLNLMFERPLSEQLDFRYGVYASKPGVGVSYAVAPKLWFRSDLFGLNDPQLDFRMRYDFSSGFHGWLGIERLFERNSPAIGIGIRR